jgi:hypothetical protein
MLDHRLSGPSHQFSQGGSLKTRTRLAAAAAAAAAATVIGGVIPTAGAAPVSQQSWYKVQLDPVTTRLLASDPAQALADAAWTSEIPESVRPWVVGYLHASLFAKYAADAPNGCVELHFSPDVDNAYSSTVGTIHASCPWVVPSVQPEPYPGPFAYWERGEAR